MAHQEPKKINNGKNKMKSKKVNILKSFLAKTVIVK